MTKRDSQAEEYSLELHLSGGPEDLLIGDDRGYCNLVSDEIVSAKAAQMGTHRIRVEASMDMGTEDARKLAAWLTKAADWVEATS